MSGIISMEELNQKFKDQWVLMEVLEEDEFDEPRKVRVIATSKNRDEIYEKQKEIKGDRYPLYWRDSKKGLCGGFQWLS